MSQIAFQTRIEKLHHESMHFPTGLYGKLGTHRLQITGRMDVIANLLSQFTLPSREEWIVFASEDVLADPCPPVTRINLDREQSRRFEWLSMFAEVCYGTFADLGKATDLMNCSLWDLAAGIALPSQGTGEGHLAEALEIQLALGDRLMQTIEGGRGAFVLACTDAWGVDVVWSEAGPYALQFGKTARRLTA